MNLKLIVSYSTLYRCYLTIFKQHRGVGVCDSMVVGICWFYVILLVVVIMCECEDRAPGEVSVDRKARSGLVSRNTRV